MRQWTTYIYIYIYKNSWRWTCKCPKHVEAIYENKIIVNCCIKLVHLLTYIYDARSHLRQIAYSYFIPAPHTRARASLHNSCFYVPISIIPTQLLLTDFTIISPFQVLFASPLSSQNIILTLDSSKSRETRVINLARFYITGQSLEQTDLPAKC